MQLKIHTQRAWIPAETFNEMESTKKKNNDFLPRTT